MREFAQLPEVQTGHCATDDAANRLRSESYDATNYAGDRQRTRSDETGFLDLSLNDPLERQGCPDARVAWDANKMLRDTGEAALQKAGFFSHRGHEDDHVDYEAAAQAWKLADLGKLGVPKNTIGAILRNEQHYFKTTDDDQDRQVKEKGTVLKSDGSEDSGASIGPAQMQIRNIRKLVGLADEHGKAVYPFLQQMSDDPVRSALKPEKAALLVAAQLAEIAKDQKMNAHIDKPTVQQLVYGYNDDVHSYQSGKDKVYISRDPVQLRAERLMHPDLKREMYPTNQKILDTSVHVQHVMSQLKILDER